MITPRRVCTLCVGLARYPPGALRADERALEFASLSAQDLHRLFRELWPSESSHSLLIDAEATPEAIAAALLSFSKRNFDLLVFYFAGHGRLSAERKFSLVTVSGGSRIVELGAHEVDELLRKSAAPNILILLDACYAGAFVAESNVLRDAKFRIRICLASSTAEQRSWEDSFSNRTLFADALVTALTAENVSQTAAPASILGELFPFVSEYVARHAYGLKAGAVQEPVIGAVCASPIAIPRSARIAGQELSTAQVLLRRTRQVLTAVGAVVFVGAVFVFLATWRPALNESGFLELRHGPKWLSALNVGPWRKIVETDLNNEKLKDPSESPEVVERIQNETGIYPWPGMDSSGIRRWADVVIRQWVTESVAMLWSVRMGVEGVKEQLSGKNVRIVPEAKATEYAAEYSLLRPDQPELDTWKSQWTDTAFQASCGAGDLSGRTSELAELYLGLAPDDQTANWLRGLALTATFDDRLGFDRVIQLIGTFKAMRLSWEKDYRGTLVSETEPLSPARVAKVFSKRPTRVETSSLADLAESVVMRRLRAGQPGLDARERSELIGSINGCGDWVVPVLARLGPFGDPAAITAWARTKPAGDQERNSLLVLANYGLLDSATIEWLLTRNGFDGDYSAKKSALTNAGEWLVDVAQQQALPKTVVEELLAFSGTAIGSDDYVYAGKALKPLAWNARYLSASEQSTLEMRVNDLHQRTRVQTADETELRGILGLKGLGDPETNRWGALAELVETHEAKVPSINFPPSGSDAPGQPTRLSSGWKLNDLIAASRIVSGLPKESRLYRNAKTLGFLENAARDGIRARVSIEKLKPVFEAISNLRCELSPGNFDAQAITTTLKKARDNYAQRQLTTEIAMTVLHSLGYSKKIAILAELRHCWKEEQEPETKYALATIIIESYRREKLPDLDLKGFFPASQPATGAHSN